MPNPYDYGERALEDDKPDIKKAFEEVGMVLPEDDPLAKKLAPELDRITTRLLQNIPPDLKARYEASGKKVADLKFKLSFSATEIVNAMIHKGESVNTVYTTKGLWEFTPIEDELAGVISHELNHTLLGEVGNKKIEETLCDRYTIETLYRAGYKHDGLIDLFKRFPEEKESFIKPIADQHPTNGNRIRALQYQIHEIETQTGKLFEQRKPTPIPQETAQAIKDLKYRNVLQKKLDAEGYEKAETAKKFEVLARNARQFLGEHAGRWEYAFRIRQVYHEVDALFKNGTKLNKNNSAEVQAFNELVDVVASMTSRNELIYVKSEWQGVADDYAPAAYHKLACIAGKADPIKDGLAREQFHKAGLIGNFERLGPLQQAFLDAKTPEQADAAAKAFLKVYGKHVHDGLSWGIVRILNQSLPAFQRENSSEVKHFQNAAIEATRLKGPTNWEANLRQAEGVDPSWKQHAQWAKAHPAIHVMLGTMSIDSQAKHSLEAIATALSDLGIQPSEMEKMAASSRDLDHRLYNDRNQILGRRYSGLEFKDIFPPSPENRRIRQQARNAEEAALLAKGEWKAELGKTTESWKEFIKKYQPYLEPEIEYEALDARTQKSRVGGEDRPEEARNPAGRKFISAFLEHITQLRMQEPDIYAPLVSDFFTHEVCWLHELMCYKVKKTELGEQQVLVRMRIADNHPYIEFVQKHSEWIEDGGLKVAGNRINTWRALRLEDPQSLEAAKRNFPKLMALYSTQKWQHNRALTGDAIPRTALAFFTFKKGTACTPEELLYLKFCAENTKEYYKDNRSAESTNPSKEILNKQLTINYQDLVSRNAPVEEWIEHYRAARTGNPTMLRLSYDCAFSDNLPLQREFEMRIKAKLEALPLSERGKHAERLLYQEQNRPPGVPPEHEAYANKHSGFEFKYSDLGTRSPEFSQYLLDTLGDYKARQIGGVETPKNQTAIKAVIDEVVSKVSAVNAEPVLARFAEKVQTQKELSYYIRDELDKSTKAQSQGTRNSVRIGAAESAIEFVCADEKTRQSFIDFIQKPYSERNAERVRKIVDARLKDSKDIELKNLFSNENSIETLRGMHEQYWSASQKARTFGADQILFPSSNYNAEVFEQGKPALPIPLCISLPFTA